MVHNGCDSPLVMENIPVALIEDMLLKDEKISLIFLLFDQTETALQYALLCHTPLQDWWHQSRTQNKRDKLREALCLLGCYKILKKLGISKEEANARYLPDSFDSLLHLNQVRKVLYKICEALNEAECKKLVSLVWQGRSGEEQYRYKALNLELYFLAWMSIGIISQTNLDGVAQALKIMGKRDFQEKLLAVTKRANQAAPETLHKRVGSLYRLDPKNMGLCIIVNQKNFLPAEGQPSLETRTGTDLDRDRLQETFLMFGYEVKILENQTSHELNEGLPAMLKNKLTESHSSIVLCVLSHGEEGRVYCTDKKRIDIDELKRMLLECERLRGKPKLFFIQACQGNSAQKAVSHPPTENLATDSPGASTTQSPFQADCMTFYSTVPGSVSFRDLLKGSMFIRALCSSLVRFSLRYGLFDIVYHTNYLASNTILEIEKEACTMMPECRSTLRCDFKLSYNANGIIEATRMRIQRALFNKLLNKFLSGVYRDELKKK